MATTVAQHSVATFTSPVNGTTPIDANTVRGKDNTIRTSYNDHDADTGIHVQSSTLASRPAAGTAGRKWITDDSGVYTLWFDDGTNWHPVSSENIALTVLAGENLVKGDVVKVTGWNNGQDLPEVVKTTSAADTAFAVITATVTSGSMGYATNTGIVQDVNTAAYSVGTILYANGSGGFTSTKPTSGNYQPVAYVLRANASNGVYYVEFSTPRIVERSDNVASTVVLRDASGDFSAGTITATAVNATTLDLTNLEVTNIKAKDGTQAIAIADTTGKLTISDGVLLSALTASQAVFTDGSKNLVSNAITGTGNVVMSASPTLSGTISAANLSLSGTLGVTSTVTFTTPLADSNLATISTAGKVSNSATTATSANTASAIVARDASGNFSAGTITATLSGSASSLTTTRTLWGQNFNGTANVTGSLTSVGDITGTAGVTLTATAGTLALAATGANNVDISTNGSARWRVNSAGHLLAVTDASFDIGASGATRPRDLFLSRNIVAGGGVSGVTDNGGNFGVRVRARASDDIFSVLEFTNNAGTSRYAAINGVSTPEMRFIVGALDTWRINSSGHFVAGVDATYDIGASGATRPRDLYLSGNATAGGWVRASAASAGAASTTTIGNTTATTVGAAGGASALPATPLGYIIAHVGTTQVKIPYYNV